MRVLVSFCCLLLSSAVLAETALPAGCRPVAVKGESVTLKSKNSKLVFVHNLTEGELWITHPVADSGASAGWNSRLQAGNWSALAVDKSPFVLNCIESKPGHEQQLPCEGAIAVCQWPGVKIPNDLQGNTFWAAEDKPLAELTAALGGRGFVLPAGK